MTGFTMSSEFDPYEKWLGISKEERPITCYSLLGLEPFERDLDKIERAAKIRISALDGKRQGPHGEHVEKVVKRVRQAALLLLDPDQKVRYDRKLSDEGRYSGDEDTTELSGKTHEMRAITDPSALPPAAPPAGPSSKPAPPKSKPAAPGSKPAAAAPRAVPAAVPAARQPAAPKAPAAIAPPGPSSFFRNLGAPLAQPGPAGAAPAGPRSGGSSRAPQRKKSNPLPLYGGIGAVAVLAAIGGWVVFGGGGSSPPAGKSGTKTVAAGKGKEGAAAEAAAPAFDDPLAARRPKPAATEPSAPAAPAPAATATPDVAVTSVAAAPAEPEEPDEIDWTVSADPPAGLVGPPTAEALAALNPSGALATVAADWTGKRLAALGKDGKLHTWNLESGSGESVAAKVPLDQLAWLKPDVLLGLTVRGNVVTLDPNTGAVAKEWSIPVGGTGSAVQTARGIAVSPGGKFIAICRKGLRFYEGETGRLAGIVKLPPGQAVAAMGFDPLGDKLLFVAQQVVGMPIYRKLEVDLKSGQTNFERVEGVFGNLLDDDLQGGLTVRPSPYVPLWMVGNRWILRQDDGRLAATYGRNAPFWVLPLEGGDVWWGSKAGSRVDATNWEDIANACRASDRTGSSREVGINEPIVLKVNVTGGADPGGLQKALLAAMTARLESFGMKITDKAEGEIVVTVTEGAAGPVRTVYRRHEDGSTSEASLPKPLPKSFGAAISIEVNAPNAPVKQPHKLRLNFVPTDVVLTAEQAASASEADYRKAYEDSLAAFVAGINLPYYLADGITGYRRLPEDVKFRKKGDDDEAK